ncbi:MAG TPA: FAD-dependent oxidoreductase [Methylomirabilota bacterium]|jgi:sarcosine oxidase, subunit beta|nr:FAD-dependent oxidoreductase [Methylomirabilota bacterium]
MVATADSVIVGAGIMGASTAYHLARRGYGRIVVLERGAVCSGSTALASGGIRHQYANRIGIELTRQSIRVYSAALQRALGVDTRVLAPDDVRALCPYLWTGDLASATYSPRDGFADPYLVTTAIAARARDLGVVIEPDREVTGFTRGRRGATVIAGFSGHGFMHGPIAGQLMAELVADRRAHTVDIAPLDLDRFRRGETPVEVMTFV